jgi:hypothetical protein
MPQLVEQQQQMAQEAANSFNPAQLVEKRVRTASVRQPLARHDTPLQVESVGCNTPERPPHIGLAAAKEAIAKALEVNSGIAAAEAAGEVTAEADIQKDIPTIKVSLQQEDASLTVQLSCMSFVIALALDVRTRSCEIHTKTSTHPHTQLQ